MPTYLKPLRRKFGVVTLVTACLFMVGWVRSQRVLDVVTFPAVPPLSKATGSGELISWKRGILLVSRVRSNNSSVQILPRLKTFSSSNSMAQSMTTELGALLDSSIIRWSLKWCGVGYGEQIEEDTGFGGVWFFVLPYWSIVIPLTLLSAWLLLSLTRSPKPLPPVTETAG